MPISALNFSDLILSEGAANYREEGALKSLPSDLADEASRLYVRSLELSAKGNSCEFSFRDNGITYRAVTFSDASGPCVILRKLAHKIYTWRDLRLNHRLLNIMLSGDSEKERPVMRGGMIIVCGETDSGKSTTLNAIVDAISSRESWLTISLEDPIEITFDQQIYNTGAMIIQREMVSSEFAKGLHTAFRSNADVIKVSEIRDPDAARVASDAAMTGHLVLATMHGASIPLCLQRLAKMLGENGNELLSSTLRCCLHQKLEVGPGFNNRLMSGTFVLRTADVKNMIRDGSFPQLDGPIQSHTKKYM